MLTRRSFGLSLLAVSSSFLAACKDESSSFLAACKGSCFDSDFFSLGYDSFYWSIFELAERGALKAFASGHPIRPEVLTLFEIEHLYEPVESSIAVAWRKDFDGFELARVQFELECGMPIVGCLGVPKSKPRGLVLLAHGMGSLPERCFTDEQPDYMKGIGKRLCQDGYAVWCPYIFQAGNQNSQNNMAAMLTSLGLSLHGVSCSSLQAGEQIAKSVAKISGLKSGCYGVSWGALLVLHLEAATSARRPTVASGYLRDDREMLSSATFFKNLPFEFTSYIHFNDNEYKFAGRKLATLLRPAPIYFEVGSEDTWSSNLYGRDRTFEAMRSAYEADGHGNLITLGVFEGPHEAHGIEARKWLLSQI